MMTKKKHNFRERFLQFLTKIFWHLKQQPAPSYLSINSKHSKSLTKKNNLKSASIDRYYIRSQYPPQYRTCSMRERTSTLTSIEEE
jgi:hypothetical protein